MTCVWLSQVDSTINGAIDGRANNGKATSYTFTIDASVVEARNETITASLQSSVLYQNTRTMSNVDKAEAAARHIDQLAQVLFAGQHLFSPNATAEESPRGTSLYHFFRSPEQFKCIEGKQGI